MDTEVVCQVVTFLRDGCSRGGRIPARVPRRFLEDDWRSSGRYLEVTPPSRLVWTNDEAAGAGAVTTVTFEEQGGKTLVVMHDLYPSKEALDEGVGSYDGMSETMQQLDELLVTLGASAARS